jgi:hypothetical protein
MDSQIFRVQLQGSKPMSLKSFLYHWKTIKTYMSKMGSCCSFTHLKHKLWPKEGREVKLPVKTNIKTTGASFSTEASLFVGP